MFYERCGERIAADVGPLSPYNARVFPGDYQGAEAYYRRALELDPENLAFLDNLSAALVRLNKWEVSMALSTSLWTHAEVFAL